MKRSQNYRNQGWEQYSFETIAQARSVWAEFKKPSNDEVSSDAVVPGGSLLYFWHKNDRGNLPIPDA